MTNIPIIMVSIMLAFILLSGLLIRWALNNEKKIHEEGTETDSVVSRVECRRRDGHRRYTCFVKYIDNTGIEREAVLNVSSNLPIGRKIKIKYLPDKYDYVVFISQELEN